MPPWFGEPTLLAFYERPAPFAEPFIALFGRNQLPHRSTRSRFLAALDQNTVEAVRAHFQEDLLARNPFASSGGLFDRMGKPLAPKTYRHNHHHQYYLLLIQQRFVMLKKQDTSSVLKHHHVLLPLVILLSYHLLMFQNPYHMLLFF